MRHPANQSGFSLVEGLLALVIVAIVGATGYYVWHSKQAADSTLTAATKTTQNTAAAKSTANSNVTPVYTKPGANLYSLASLAATTDQQSLAAVASAACVTRTGSDSNPNSANAQAVAAETNFFSDKHFFIESGDFARMDASCFVPPTPTYDSLELGAIYQKQGSDWSVLTSDQNGIACSDVDGKNIPKTVVPSCNASNGSVRAPN